MCGKEGYARNDNHRLRRWLSFCLPPTEICTENLLEIL